MNFIFRSRKHISFIFILVFFSEILCAQFPNVLISTLNEPEEVCIAINPKNTNQIVAGANLDNAYRSMDGGLTWSLQTIFCNPYNVYGDPVVIWDTASTCYYLHLSVPDATVGTWIDRIVIQRSADLGQNYSTCSATGKNGTKAQDKPWAVVNPANNELHVTWTQFDNYGSSAASDSSTILYSKSSDQGMTWSAPKRISFYAGDCIDSDNTVEGAVPAVGPNGQLYVGWAGPKGLVFQKSTDGGATWLPNEKIITPIVGGWDYDITGLVRSDGLPFTFCDLSNGPNKGAIYINYSDHTNGPTDGDIWVVKSIDGGNTWTPPVRVNDDVPGKEQFMSTMTIDQVTGFVYVLFYDRRNFASGTSTDVYMGVSRNGGVTYQNYKVNASTFNPSTNVFFGDYIGISAHNNVVRPMWTQLSGSALKVYTALIDQTVLGIYDAKTENLGGIHSAPNPFKTETQLSFDLKKAAKLTIQLVNAEGKILNVLFKDALFEAGRNAFSIISALNGLKPGVYYVVFYGEEKSRYVKLVME